MARLEVKRQMGRGDIAAVSELLEVANAVDGHRPLGEHQWLDLVQGGREGFAGLVAWEPGHEHPVGYAQLTTDVRGRRRPPGHRGPDGDPAPEAPVASWALELVVDPHHRDRMVDVGRRLVESALDVVRQEGGGHVHLWVPQPVPEHDEIAAAAGLRRGRELQQLRRSLPVGEPWSLPVRAFVPGRDEAGWLEVNNRAFRSHPEQGGWSLETLLRREAQPWFDPAGLLVHERDGRMAGFCWTKVHDDEHPPLGEIYVVAVDPDFRGLGLGRALVLAGLDLLFRRGIRRAMLYVDSDNVVAVRLYRSLGFTLHHADRAYVADVDPVAPSRAPQAAAPPTPTTDPTP